MLKVELVCTCTYKCFQKFPVTKMENFEEKKHVKKQVFLSIVIIG